MPRLPAVVFVLVTVFLDVLGIGIIIPVLPRLVIDFFGGDASQSAPFYGLIASAFAIMQFLFAPTLGALSDRFGRRPVLLLALCGFALSYLVMATAPSFAWLLVARVLAGMFGASFTTANAYIADVSTSENRAHNFGLMGAMFGLGFICGPALGGWLGHLGPRVPFFAAAAVAALNVLYGLFVLPESLPPEKRRAFDWRRANPVGGLAVLGRHPVVARLAVAFLLAAFSHRGLESIWVLYTEHRFGWMELHNGMALALVGVLAVVVQGGLVRRIVPVLGEQRSLLLGLGVAAAGMVLYGLASQGWMMLAVIVLASPGAIAQPALQSIIAASVPSNEQGAVQGSLTSLMSLTAVVSPLVASQLFAVFTRPASPVVLPGAPFFLNALVLAGALVLASRAFLRRATVPTLAAPAAPGSPP